jgi:acetyltransferase-like isoleucine patch superfamily enzyme
MIGKLLRAVFYSPGRHARRLPFLSLGEGSALLPSARFTFRQGENGFKGRLSIGKGSMFGGEMLFESDQGEIHVGDRCFINGGTRLISRSAIRIGDNVTIAWGCTIYDHNSHSLDWRERERDLERQFQDLAAGRNFIHSKNWEPVTSRPIEIGDKAWIGFGVTILNGARIGEGAVVGAQSVVRGDVPAWTVVAGNPAVVIREIARE